RPVVERAQRDGRAAEARGLRVGGAERAGEDDALREDVPLRERIGQGSKKGGGVAVRQGGGRADGGGAQVVAGAVGAQNGAEDGEADLPGRGVVEPAGGAERPRVRRRVGLAGERGDAVGRGGGG